MKRYILITVIALLCVSCREDLLDKAPKDSLNPSIFWNSEEDAEVAANELYAHLPTIRNWLYKEMISDFAIGSSGDGGRNDALEGTSDANGGLYRRTWSDGYTRIAATNFFLENIDKVESIEELTIERYKSEARFIRAMVYLEMVMDFGDVPLLKHTVTVSKGASVKRTDRYEIFDFIITEMDEIEQWLPFASELTAERAIGRVTKGAAQALKARAGLYAGSVAQNFNGPDPTKYFESAREACIQIINSDEYALYPDFSQLFSYEAEYSGEIIFSRIYMKGFLSHGTFINNAPNMISGNSFVDITITKALVDKFQMKETGKSIDAEGSGYNPVNPYFGRDPRLEATMYLPAFNDTSYCSIIDDKRFDPRPNLPSSMRVKDVLSLNGGATKSGFVLKKYINPEKDAFQGANDGTNLILFRYGDVLLMLAEALIELNMDLPEAVSQINAIRERAGMPVLESSGYSSADLQNQSILREIVRQERSIELAMEGLRFYDIRRWKIAEELIDGPIEGMTYEDYKTKEITTFYWVSRVRIFDPEKDYLFPIPSTEREINPDLTQNPGY